MFTVVVCAESIRLKNTAVSNGSTASFSCTIHAPASEVCWSYQTVSLEKFSYWYEEGSLASVCDNNKCNVTLDNETDRYTLNINSAQLYDSGLYECSECMASVQRALLIVIQSTDISEGKWYF